MNALDSSRRRALSMAAASAVWALPLTARAQAWPSRTIRFVVPFAPGGSSEIVARSVAAELSKSLGQSMYVDNKPGGAGNVAMGEVARADDQHTLILGYIGTLAVNPFIFDKLPYDPVRDFKPISLLAKVPGLYVVTTVVVLALFWAAAGWLVALQSLHAPRGACVALVLLVFGPVCVHMRFT